MWTQGTALAFRETREHSQLGSLPNGGGVSHVVTPPAAHRGVSHTGGHLRVGATPSPDRRVATVSHAVSTGGHPVPLTDLGLPAPGWGKCSRGGGATQAPPVRAAVRLPSAQGLTAVSATCSEPTRAGIT